jgi:geranylgeranyl reductase family protein
MAQWDFAVIGGGPAGASAARRLARQGASVVVFERRKMPRDKPCGGGLSERAMARLDFELPPALVDAELYGGRAHFGPVWIEVRLERRVAVLVTRSRFDHFLLSMAEAEGARVEWQEVRRLAVRPGEVALQTPAGEVTARCAIVCEGANRRLSRAVRRRDGPGEQGFCLEADVPVPRPDPYADIRGLTDIYFGVAAYGYGWIFHHGSYYSVGIGGLCLKFKAPVETFRRFVADRGLALNGAAVRGRFVPCGGIRRRVCADRLLLAGDAAGWVDPFQGEGLAYAVHSGQLAAEAALGAAARNDFSRRRLAAYEGLCREAFGRDLRAARTIMRIAHRWPSLMIRSMASTERVLGQYLHVTRGELSYREFLRWVLVRLPGFWLRTEWQRIARRTAGG